MADLAIQLLRLVTRTFYTTDHILVLDALITHSTLPDTDLSFLLSMQPKHLRRICGRLKEDGLLSIQSRAERRTDGTQSFYPGQQGKERVMHKDWYYLNFHRAIDAIKYRMHKLHKHVESLGAPTTEKKDLVCPRCRSQYTDLEAMDRLDFETGAFLCHKCGHELDRVKEDDRVSENESMKRLNSQMQKIVLLMQQIDATTVPENDFQTALSKYKPVIRTDANPGQQRTETLDLPDRNMQSTKGLTLQPEKIAVQIQDDETVKREREVNEAAAKREKEARQNAVPDWIAKSTVSGEITAAGAKEERLRRERGEGGSGGVGGGTGEEGANGEAKAKAEAGGEEDVMAAYWEELAKAQAEEAQRAKESEEEEDEEDEDEDDFEDVDVSGPGNGASATPDALNGTAANATSAALSGSNTPALESSNATDDERESKRARVEETAPNGATAPASTNGTAATAAEVAEGTPAASDEDDDEDEGLEFENV